MRLLFVILRFVVAAAIVAAIVGQLARTVGLAQQAEPASVGFVTLNFFSFFTIDSNAGSVVVLVVGAVLAIRAGGLRAADALPSSRGDASTPSFVDPRLFSVVRACVVTYMVTTGVVYNLLLRNIALPQGQTVEWSNEILHVIGPIYLLLDWLFAPGRPAIDWKQLWAIVAFPIVWVIYTLIRGPLAINAATGKNWYPYPFLDPSLSANGYLSVTFYVILIALVICVIGAGVIWVSRRGRARLAQVATA